MRKIIILLLFVISFSASAKRVLYNNNDFGAEDDSDIFLCASFEDTVDPKPCFKYDFVSGAWKVSDDGTTYTNIIGALGTGDVTGPFPSTDNAIARYDLATGKIIQDSGVLIDDSNNITGIEILSINQDLLLLGTGQLLLPTGTTAERTGTPIDGMIRFNTDLNDYEQYKNASWGAMGITSHAGLSGLLNDDHTQYVLLNGRITGQTIIGGTGAGEVLSLESTSHGTKGEIYVDGIHLKKMITNSASTGLQDGGALAINVDTTKFDISAGHGHVINSYTDSITPTHTDIEWTAFTALSVTNIATNEGTHIYITSAGNVLQSVIEPTPQLRRGNIYLGKLVHIDNVNILNANSQPESDLNIGNAITDFWKALGPIIISGNRISANGANLSIDKSAGDMHQEGINFQTDKRQPNIKTLPAQIPVTFLYTTQDGTGGAPTILIEPLSYDVGGVITAIAGSNNQATNQRIYLYNSGQIRIQYGQQVYSTLAAAVEGLTSEVFLKESDIKDNAILVSALSIIKGATDLTNVAEAKFSPASKFGEISIGTGASAISTLQNAYDNSITPEVVLDATRGAFTIEDNSTPLGANLLEVQSSAGATTFFSVDENGVLVNGHVSQTGLSDSTYFGFNSGLSDDLTLNGNTGFGYEANRSVTTGLGNTGLGYKANRLVSTGAGNTAIGWQALLSATTSSRNVAIGQDALKSMFSNIGNGVAIGFHSQRLMGNGGGNTSVGSETLYRNNSGSYNTVMGRRSGYETVGTHNVYIGNASGDQISSSNSNRNVFIGSQAGDSSIASNDNILIGYDVDLPTASTSNYMNIANLLYGDLTNFRIGVGVSTPATKFEVAGSITSTGENINGRLKVASTTSASKPCPPMTEAQRDAVSPVPEEGDCVVNIDTNELNFYLAGVWGQVGGGSITTTEGDLIVRGATEDIKLPIGNDGEWPVVDSTVAGKIKYTNTLQGKLNPVTNIAPDTCTSSWTTNTTTTCNIKRNGDTATITWNVALTGAPNSTTLEVYLPSGLIVDTSKMLATVNKNLTSRATLREDGVQVLDGVGRYNTTSNFRVVQQRGSTSVTSVNATVPFVWGANDFVDITIKGIPIVGWTSGLDAVVQDKKRSVVEASNTTTQVLTANVTNIIAPTERSDTDNSFLNGIFTANTDGYYLSILRHRSTTAVGRTVYSYVDSVLDKEALGASDTLVHSATTITFLNEGQTLSYRSNVSLTASDVKIEIAQLVGDEVIAAAIDSQKWDCGVVKKLAADSASIGTIADISHTSTIGDKYILRGQWFSENDSQIHMTDVSASDIGRVYNGSGGQLISSFHSRCFVASTTSIDMVQPSVPIIRGNGTTSETWTQLCRLPNNYICN